MNLADLLRHWARWQPEAVAIRFEGTDITWHDLDRRTDALAAGFRAMGIGHGDRIGLLLGNCPAFIETALAAWKLGAIVVPFNVRYTPPEVRYVVEDAGCAAVVTDEALRPGLALVADRQPVLLADRLATDVARPGEAPPYVDTSDDHPATICYTSGTTGDPKGAVLTHGSWAAGSRGWMMAIELGAADRVYLPFPLAFTGGFAVSLFTYWSGAMLLLERAFDPTLTLRRIEEDRVTALLSVPQILQALVDHPRWADTDLSSWRIACAGGAPVPEALITVVQARGIPMLQTYSLTEASAAATMLPNARALDKLGSAGLPVIHGRIRIVDEDDRDVPAGTVGEICLAGPSVMAGYWNKPEASAETLRGGWLHTGDLGRLDDDGYLFVVDRAKDMLISGGLNVYPAEIERLLAGLPGVVEVAVIGVPDTRWGETPAVIAFTNGAELTGQAVLDACAGQLADFKLPRYLVVSENPLPRNMSGKILKRELRDTYRALPATATPIR
jgi:fatty-acyl-CoA synthase